MQCSYVSSDELAEADASTRLADRLWRFESLDIDFTADIAVDEDGFVMEYPGLFRREF